MKRRDGARARFMESVLVALALGLMRCARPAGPAGTERSAKDREPVTASAAGAVSAVSPVSAGAAASASNSAGASATAGPDGGPADMIFVPAGSFDMGAERGGQEDERPVHRVTLRAFWLDTTEVTNEAYERCVTARVCRPHDLKSSQQNHFGDDGPFRAPRQPISSISWDDAKAFCQWAGKRLPTEAEWEKAARGTDGRRYPWGNEPADPERAVFATSRTAEVGTHPKGAGAYGHLDMAGNVWEWLEDIYDPYAYRRAGADRGIPGTCDEAMAAQDELRRKGQQGFTGSNPIPTECERVLRGGAFNYDGPGLRSSNRVHHPPRFRLIMSGFRCAKDG